MAQTLKTIPQICQEQLSTTKNFVSDIIAKYKSLANWGKPIFTSEMQIACVLWINERLGIGLQEIANYLGIDKTTLYKLVRRIEEQGRFNIFNIDTKTIVTITMSKADLIEMVEKALQPRAKVVISDIMESSIVREFLVKDVEKRSKVLGHKPVLTEKLKKETLRVVKRLIEYFAKNGMATNPDVWDEKAVEKALYDIYNNDYAKIRRAMIALRRVQQWSKWFEGKIGAVTKFITPKLKYITYEHYLRLKDAWKNGGIPTPEFLVVWLHLTIGSREGYEAEGITDATKLEDANTSLIGLRWERLYQVGDTFIIQVYESKTGKTWTCDLSWLDAEPISELLKYRKEKGSIIASITGIETVGRFIKWYRRVLEKLSKLLGLEFMLTPHDIRRSHISILAELGVPLEIAVSGHMDFGVGWEDLKTAVVFYLRFSRYVKQKVMEEIHRRQAEIQAIAKTA
jgi:DNA-binding MarR family transcriptional regulator